MDLFNLVMMKEDSNEILRELILLECIEFKDTFKDIDDSNFILAMKEENKDRIIDIVDISRCDRNKDLKDTKERILYILNKINFEPEIDGNYMGGNYTFESVKNKIDIIYNHFKELADEIDALNKKIEAIENFSWVNKLKGLDINFKQFLKLENFVVKWGYLTKENRKKIANNYENISAVVVHIGADSDKEIYLVISPKELELETNRILRSVNFHEIEPLIEYFDYPEIMVKNISKEKNEIKKRLKTLNEVSKEYINKYQIELNRCYSRMIMEEKIDLIKEKIVMSEHLIYLSAWIPSEDKKRVNNYFEPYDERIILTMREAKGLDSRVKIPTKLKNNFIFRPFEELVKMYGVPDYNEIDPTMFFAIGYMLLFGGMFGDLGQGFLIFLAGIIIGIKKNKNYGGILARLGIASMIFGIAYDSFFGYENVISKFLPNLKYFRPLENINEVLIISIFVGVILLTISFLFSITNKLKQNDIEEGVFGRNGIVGMTLFLSLFIIVVEKVTLTTYISISVLTWIVVVAVLLIVVKQPLANIVKGKRPLYKEKASEYYVESGFNILETFLSILSNSISFIRVGAFAINHVGLFIAFHTIAHMIGGVKGSISMFIVGNIIVIFLEGLIVFIQGLRLMYYELFSKYYNGDGEIFSQEKIYLGSE